MLGSIQLYRHDVEFHGLVEELRVADLHVTDQSTIGVRISDQPRQLQLLLMNADALIQSKEVLGRLDLYYWLYSPTTERSWYWRLSSWELQRVEEMRGGHDLQLDLRGTGIGRILSGSGDPERETSSTVPVQAHAHLEIPVSEWEILLTKLGYRPAKWLSLPLESGHWPNWSKAVSRMRRATTALSRGETHQALEECLGVLEALRTSPYSVNSWKDVFDVDSQKDEGLQALISGIGTYLNKVGHHRSREERDEHGDLVKSQVDQYEAETLVAMTQLLIAYIERLPRKTPID